MQRQCSHITIKTCRILVRYSLLCFPQIFCWPHSLCKVWACVYLPCLILLLLLLSGKHTDKRLEEEDCGTWLIKPTLAFCPSLTSGTGKEDIKRVPHSSQIINFARKSVILLQTSSPFTGYKKNIYLFKHVNIAHLLWLKRQESDN